MFDLIDATGIARKDDPRLRDVEEEMIRSHASGPPFVRV